MYINDDSLYIKSNTSGFASPAQPYVKKRLDINDLVIDNVHSTFFFRYRGSSEFGIDTGSFLVVDRACDIEVSDIVVILESEGFKLKKFNNQCNVWGKVVWNLKKM